MNIFRTGIQSSVSNRPGGRHQLQPPIRQPSRDAAEDETAAYIVQAASPLSSLAVGA